MLPILSALCLAEKRAARDMTPTRCTVVWSSSGSRPLRPSGWSRSAACTVSQPQPNLVGQDIRLTFIHTSDIHSRLFPYNFVPNTFDRRTTACTRTRRSAASRGSRRSRSGSARASNRSLWLDSGDCFQGAPVFNLFKGEAEMRALSLAGMDGAVIGNHEFDLGAKNLFDQIDNWATFPLLAANYAWDDPPAGAVNPDGRSLRDVVPPFAIYDVKGLKVGVIGMGNTSTITVDLRGRQLARLPAARRRRRRSSGLGPHPAPDRRRRRRRQPPRPRRGRGPDRVAGRRSERGVQRETLAGVDLILGGHLHIVTNPPKLIPNDDAGPQHDPRALGRVREVRRPARPRRARRRRTTPIPSGAAGSPRSPSRTSRSTRSCATACRASPRIPTSRT